MRRDRGGVDGFAADIERVILVKESAEDVGISGITENSQLVFFPVVLVPDFANLHSNFDSSR